MDGVPVMVAGGGGVYKMCAKSISRSGVRLDVQGAPSVYERVELVRMCIYSGSTRIPDGEAGT